MTNRDRLIELINDCRSMDGYGMDLVEKQADHLLANGVIVPPCKVGDIIWTYDFMWRLIPCTVDKPYRCVCGEKGGCTFEMCFADDDFGKTVFLTKEEAEKALKEREDNG